MAPSQCIEAPVDGSLTLLRMNRMPRSLTLAVVVVVVALAAIANESHAQPVRASLLQFSLGAGSSTGGDYEEREDYTAELMLARPFRGGPSHGLLLGVVAGKTFVNGSDLTCRVSAGSTECVPLMPRFGYASAVLGAEQVNALGTVSVAAGPGVALGAVRSLHPGLLFRADYATPAIRHLSLAVSGRGLAITGVGESTIVLRSLNVGVRVR